MKRRGRASPAVAMLLAVALHPAAFAQEGAQPAEQPGTPAQQREAVPGDASTVESSERRADETPEAAVRQLHNALVEVAAELGGDSVEARYRALEPVVEATHDLPYIAQLTIRREWAALPAAQRARFVDAFTRLSVMTYASRFRNLQAGMFEIAGSEPVADGRAQVRATLMTADGDAIPFQYVLHETARGWKIINILARDVSDLALKRAEYRGLLQDGTIDDLIAELERQANGA